MLQAALPARPVNALNHARQTGATIAAREPTVTLGQRGGQSHAIANSTIDAEAAEAWQSQGNIVDHKPDLMVPIRTAGVVGDILVVTPRADRPMFLPREVEFLRAASVRSERTPVVNPRERRGIATLAVISLVILAVATLAWRFVSPAVAPRINVRWAPSVSEGARLAVERELTLLRGEVKEGRTWAYDLGDISRTNVRALVAHPAVEDTHYINRSAGTVWRTAPAGTTVVGGPLNKARDSAALTWLLTASATTALVSALWLFTTGRRTSAP